MDKVTPAQRRRNTRVIGYAARKSVLALKPRAAYKAAVTLADRARGAGDLLDLLRMCGLRRYKAMPRTDLAGTGSAPIVNYQRPGGAR